MTEKDTLYLNVKSDIGDVTKDTKELTNEASNAVGEFQVMGVSLNGVKKAFASAAVTAKGMFGSIKAGLISTGIGAFVVLVGSLVTYFTSTKEGADKLDRAFTALGATMDVLKDRLSDVGEAISLAFQGKWSEAADKLKDSVTGIVAEVKEEIIVMDALEIRLQKLRDAELAFTVQKAKTRQEIEKARLNAEDETKSAKERLEALKTALTLEEKTTNRELELAREKLAIQDEQMKTSKNLVDDEAKLAQLRVELIEKETASVKMRRRVVTEVNALEREIYSESSQRLKDRQDADAEILKNLDLMLETTVDINNEIIQSDNKELENYLANNEKRKKSDEAMKVAKLGVTSAIGGAMGALGNLMAEGTAAAKAAALAEIAISTGVGIVQGLDIAQKSAKAAGPGAALAFPLFYATQLAAVLGAAAQAKAVLGAGGGGGGGGSTPSVSSSTPAPQMMSGAFDISGGVAPEATKAYVVTDEMSNSQNQLANIRRRATI